MSFSQYAEIYFQRNKITYEITNVLKTYTI